MTSPEKRVFCALADPEAGALQPDALAGVDIDVLLRAARDHNVEPVVLRKLSDPAFSGCWRDDGYRREAVRNNMFIAAMALALKSQAGRLSAALERDSIPYAIVKGAGFAGDIYPDPADRPYSDVDILIPRAFLARAGRVLRSLEFEQFTKSRFDKSAANEEQKWGYRGDRLTMVELHTDIVHVPGLRSRVSLGFEKYMLACANRTRPLAGHFVVAVVHAAAGHKFHQLRLLVDIMQATRRITKADIDHLAAALDDLRIHPEISMSLALVEQLFPDTRLLERIRAMRAALRLPRCIPIVTPQAVLDAHGEGYWSSKVRRHAFRYYQMSFAPRRRRPGRHEYPDPKG